MSDIDDCPLCLESLRDDLYFYPCPCKYQICRFCWNHIKNELDNKCPNCRQVYSDTPSFKPAPIISSKSKASPAPNNDRSHLKDLRVVQRNLAYVIGLPLHLADEELLVSDSYFGRYGKIVKLVVNKKHTLNNSHFNTVSCYVTYQNERDALACIQSIDRSLIEGSHVLKASFGTTKYCSFFLRFEKCPNANCMYLHVQGEVEWSFTKDDMKLKQVSQLVASKIADDAMDVNEERKLCVLGMTRNEEVAIGEQQGNVVPEKVQISQISPIVPQQKSKSTEEQFKSLSLDNVSLPLKTVPEPLIPKQSLISTLNASSQPITTPPGLTVPTILPTPSVRAQSRFSFVNDSPSESKPAEFPTINIAQTGILGLKLDGFSSLTTSFTVNDQIIQSPFINQTQMAFVTPNDTIPSPTTPYGTPVKLEALFGTFTQQTQQAQQKEPKPQVPRENSQPTSTRFKPFNMKTFKIPALEEKLPEGVEERRELLERLKQKHL